MKRGDHSQPAGAALRILMVLILGARDGSVRARIKVLGPDMTPLPGARAHFWEGDSWLRTSDENGCEQVGAVTGPGDRTIPLIVQLPGYKPAVVPLNTKQENLHVVTLAPIRSHLENKIVPVPEQELQSPFPDRAY